jgi:membrane protein YdbS with pleckstrin-like domain
MEQNDGSQSAEKNADNQYKIWNVSYTAIAVWCWLIAVFLVRLWVYDHVPAVYKAQVFVESILTLAIVDVVVVHAVMYYKQAQEASKQVEIAGKSLVVGSRAYVEVHSIVSSEATGATIVVIENIGKTPATGIEVEWKLYGFKEGKFYKPRRWAFDYERLAPGNFKIEFEFHFMQHFTGEETLLIYDGVKLPVFLEFQITYHDGFKKEVVDSSFGFRGKPWNKWVPMHKIRELTPNAESNPENPKPENSNPKIQIRPLP